MNITDKANQFIADMRKTKTHVTGFELIEGQRIWTHGWESGRYPQKGRFVPVELVVVDSRVDKRYKRIKVAYVNKADASTHAASYDYDEKASYLFLGDLGVRPHNYDNRVPQVFFTREALEAAIESWAGKNPNFIYV